MMMMIKDTRDVRPLLLKFGVALAISFAGFLYNRVRNSRIRPSGSPPSTPPSNSESDREIDYGGRIRIMDDPQPEKDSVDLYDKPCIRVRADSSSARASPHGRHSGDKDGFLLPEFDQLVKDLNASERDELPKTIYSVERDDYEQEIEDLKRRVKYLRERERKLEVQLLEYYGLKEQETAMMELQNRLKINNIEAELFSVKIKALQAENKRLKAEVVDYAKVVSELEDAKDKIKLLKRKIRHEAQQNKEQIILLTQRVAEFRDQQHEASSSGTHFQSELHEMVDMEGEADQLSKSNESLQQENAELFRRLESTQLLANALLEDSEKEELNKEMLQLRSENVELTKEVERLKADRCTDAEELVYLRWINACLRYELRNYQPPPGKTVARDLSKCLSPNSEKKAKELILEYANTDDGDLREPSIVDFDFENWQSSSQPSYLTDSTEHDDSPRHGSDHKPHHKKLRIFARLRKLIMGKHGHHHIYTGRISPMYRAHTMDPDIRMRSSSESPRSNSRYDDGIDESPKIASSSQNSNNSIQDPKDIEENNRISDSRSSPVGVRFVLGSESANSSLIDYRPEQDTLDSQKTELAKYAEVLRDSRMLPKMHKKSASYSVILR